MTVVLSGRGCFVFCCAGRVDRRVGAALHHSHHHAGVDHPRPRRRFVHGSHRDTAIALQRRCCGALIRPPTGLDNTPALLRTDAPSFLQAARDAGRLTAMFVNRWTQ